MSMVKKLIGFDEELEKNINEYTEKNQKTFTDAVRELITLGLNSFNVKDNQNNDIDSTVLKQEIEVIIERINKIEENTGWFKADDTQSRLGNIENSIKNIEEKINNEIEKKINVIIASSKLFKKHVDNRDIHLTD